MNEGDVVALAGDREGPVVRHLLQDRKAEALAALGSLVATYGRENVFVELSQHGVRDDARLLRYPGRFCRALGIAYDGIDHPPLCAMRGDRLLADAFSCLRHHTTLDAADYLLASNGQRHLRSVEGMNRNFAHLQEALRNVSLLEERIEFTLENLNFQSPDYPGTDGRPLSVEDQTWVLPRRWPPGPPPAGIR